MKIAQFAAGLASALIFSCTAAQTQSKDAGVLLQDGGVSEQSTSAPVLTALKAQISGRFGENFVLFASGSSIGDVVSSRVKFFSSTGFAVAVFDSNFDGMLDSNEGPLPLDFPITKKGEFQAQVTLKAWATQFPSIAQVEVSIQSSSSGSSEWLKTNVEPQPIRASGTACDTHSVLDRCQVGQGCKGTPAVCAEGSAPVFTKVAYLSSPLGPRLAIAGTDGDNDVVSLQVDFLDAKGDSVMLDLDGDEVPESNNQKYALGGTSSDGVFYYAIQSAEGFDKLVPRVAVTAADESNKTTAVQTVSLTAPPVRNVGQACDLHGFDVCAQNSVCIANAARTAGSCMGVASQKRAVCMASTVLGTSTGRMSLVGVTRTPSLWDPPTGCANNDPKMRPEATAVLRLAKAAAKVTVSTDFPETQVDTILTVFKGCGDSTAPLDCNDDGTRAPTSMLTLQNLAVGDYLIVVDSWGTDVGAYKLAVSIE